MGWRSLGLGYPRRPPSTRISVPVMLVLAAEARKTTRRATSSSVASRRVGVCAAHCSSAWAGTVRCFSVGIRPGMTMLVRMPAGPALAARLRLMPRRAALAAA